MAIYDLEVEEEFSSQDVLTDANALKQLDIMWKQIGGRLDQFRRENEGKIICQTEDLQRKWNIKMKLVVDCLG